MHCPMPLGAGDAASLEPFEPSFDPSFEPDWPTEIPNEDMFDRPMPTNSFNMSFPPIFGGSKLFPAMPNPYHMDDQHKELLELVPSKQIPYEFSFAMSGPPSPPRKQQFAMRPASLVPEYKKAFLPPPPAIAAASTFSLRRTPGAPSDPKTFINVLETEVFARKVFVGGLPIDVTETEIHQTFSHFGPVLVDWPRRPDGDGKESTSYNKSGSTRYMTGYVFLVFEDERSVQSLVRECHREGDRYYLFVSSPTMRDKPVQVRPWRLSYMEFMVSPSFRMDPRRTVFIGGVPRPTKASELAEVLSMLYGAVCYVGIDIDPELKYPKGAARVTFQTTGAFVAAIIGRFVQLSHTDSQKRVEIKPYMMDEQMCDECEGSKCSARYAPYFCGDPSCLQYYCEGCWDQIHYGHSRRRGCHRPLVRLGDQTKLLQRPPHHNTEKSSPQLPQLLPPPPPQNYSQHGYNGYHQHHGYQQQYQHGYHHGYPQQHGYQPVRGGGGRPRHF